LSDSRIAGLYRMPIDERIRTLSALGFLRPADADALLAGAPLLLAATADRMIENVVGVFGLPFGVAPNFLVNDKDYIVPMVVEEPSIVAGVSGAAKLFRTGGGFTATSTEPILTGQVQVTGVGDPEKAVQALNAARDELIELADALQPNLKARGGGARDIECFSHRLADGRWNVVLHLYVDTRDAMGANTVNTMCEGLAARVEALSGGKVVLRILSNLADRSLVTARGTISTDALSDDGICGEEIRDGIVLATDLANADPYRAATHNKGIMNGVDALAIATGNDWRAIEAGAHAFAARSGAYRALSSWSVASDGALTGELVMPLKVGIVGGSLLSNPGARAGLAIAGVSSAQELGELMGVTGLAQNFAALRALVADGIQKGHMTLHARSVAAAAGVPDGIFEQVVSGLIESGDIKTRKAEALARQLAGAGGEDRALVADAKYGEACGKVILLGEHAAVYDRHVLALPIEAAVTARVSVRPERVVLSIPAWNIGQTWTPGDSQPAGAATVIDFIMRELGLVDRGFDIRITSRIPIAMGLGSSAAFAVAVIRAFNTLIGLDKSDADIDRLAFRCEELTHGTPSGIDNNIATFGEPVLYSKSGTIKSVALAELPPLVIAASGVQGMTRDLVAGVRDRYDQHRKLYSMIFDDMNGIALAGARALQQRDYEELGSMMNVCQGLLNAIEVSTPELEKMIDIARRAGAVGAKLTGAGGGGSIVALCPGMVGQVAGALQGAGYEIVTMDKHQE